MTLVILSSLLPSRIGPLPDPLPNPPELLPPELPPKLLPPLEPPLLPELPPKLRLAPPSLELPPVFGLERSNLAIRCAESRSVYKVMCKTGVVRP